MRLINSTVEFIESQGGRAHNRGFEQQRYAFLADGSISLNAFSVATDKGLAREVTVHMDANWRPVDSYVRIHRNNRIEGYGWFRFDGGVVEAELWNHETGRHRQLLEYDSQHIAFGAHPICTDMLLAAAFDRTSGQKVQYLENIVMSSAHHFGAEGPEIAPVRLEIEYVGVEKIEAAGRSFTADHWRIISGNEKTGHGHPGEDFWTLHNSLVFVHARIDSIGFRYELSEYRETEVC